MNEQQEFKMEDTTRYSIFCFLIFLTFLISTCSEAQSQNSLSKANIIYDQRDDTPLEITFKLTDEVNIDRFILDYQRQYLKITDTQLKKSSIFSDEINQVHYRLIQYYKGLELAGVQFLVHENNGQILYAHGKLIHDLNLNVKPALSEDQALAQALQHINASSYMWENVSNEKFIKTMLNDPSASFYPEGKLLIVSKNFLMLKEEFRLAYRFNIQTELPFGGKIIDIDAINGSVINVYPSVLSGDVNGEGMTNYNGMREIIVSDTISEPTPAPPKWHLNTWQAMGGSGKSWWMADTLFGDDGGYGNNWYEVIDTDTLTLQGSEITLSFYHRYAVSEPMDNFPDYYDSWEGMNVRFSVDNGDTWQVLRNPHPAYTDSSIYSFGGIFGEGPGIPGWSGGVLDWSRVEIDLNHLSGNTVIFRFAFASDYDYSAEDLRPDLFGWQIDSILISNNQGVLFSNDGFQEGLTPHNLVREVMHVEDGKYRLRENSRGLGIATYDLHNGSEIGYATDFVDEDSSFTKTEARPGVSVHWASAATYDYYLDSHDRMSYDNQEGRIISFVHYGDNFSNAFWYGYINMAVYGDGEENKMPLVSLDVVGHELTHGVTQYSAGLIYQNEYGALNESFSDIFGTMIEHYIEGANGDWVLGEDFTPNGMGFRSLKDPNSLGYPDTYLGNFWFPETPWPSEENDYGGVHINSSVQNYWFYLLAEGGTGINDHGHSYKVDGIGSEKAGKIAYRMLTVYLMPTSRFYDARRAAMYAAKDLFGDSSEELNSVIDAWNAVGVSYPTLKPSLEFGVDTLKLSAEVAASSDTNVIQIYNRGLDTLTINTIQISGHNFTLSPGINFPIVLSEFNHYKNIEVIFSATNEGTVTDTLLVFSNDSLIPINRLYLHGTGWIIHPAEENKTYAVTSKYDQVRLLSLSESDGQTESIGSTGLADITGLVLHPLSKELWATLALGHQTTIYRINTRNGKAYEKYTIPKGNLRAITIDQQGDLFGFNAFTGELYAINDLTGSFSLLGTANIGIILGAAVNPINDQLWVSTVEGSSYKIDKTNASATYIGKSGFNTSLAICFDSEGKLFGLSGFGSTREITSFISIDTTNGTGTLIGSTGKAGVTGLVINGVVTNIMLSENEIKPSHFNLEQNHPNPFNPLTMINYQLPMTNEVELSIYNLLGERIITLVSEKQQAGSYQVEWDASGFASGVYYYRIKAGEFVKTKKLILLR